MRQLLVVAIVLAFVGCKKKTAVEPEDHAGSGSGSAVPAVALPPIPPATPGPAYVMVIDHGIARLDPDGWKVVAPMTVSSPTLALGGDGTLWAASRTHAWRLA